jgi:hypothetical protein
MSTRYVDPTEGLEAELRSGASGMFGSRLEGMVLGESRGWKGVPTLRYALR